MKIGDYVKSKYVSNSTVPVEYIAFELQEESCEIYRDKYGDHVPVYLMADEVERIVNGGTFDDSIVYSFMYRCEGRYFDSVGSISDYLGVNRIVGTKSFNEYGTILGKSIEYVYHGIRRDSSDGSD